MYKNISKSLLAVASLAMMSAAKTYKVTGDYLYHMNETGEQFDMYKDDIMHMMMDYPVGGQHWDLASDATMMTVYHISEPH